MTPIFQTIVDPERGDCMRATIASLFDLEIVQVPHFQLFKEEWFSVMYYFLYALGYDYNGCGHPETTDPKNCNVNGFCYAVVYSKTFIGSTHSVVMDASGVVVHDPNPNGLWKGTNIINTNALVYYYLLRKRENDKNTTNR